MQRQSRQPQQPKQLQDLMDWFGQTQYLRLLKVLMKLFLTLQVYLFLHLVTLLEVLVLLAPGGRIQLLIKITA